MPIRLWIYIGVMVIGSLAWLYEKLSQPRDRHRALTTLRRCTNCGAVLTGRRTTCSACPRA